MVTETLYSTPITNRDAVPRVLNADLVDNGMVREAIGTVTITSGKTLGSIYAMVSVPAHARVSQVLLDNPALSASTAFDIGCYKSTSDGSAVITAAFFGSAVACTNANAGLDVTNESGTYTVDLRVKKLWDALGLTAAPASGMIDICLTSTATNAAGGLVGLTVRYVI